MTLMDALNTASSDPFEEDGCAVYISGGTGAVATFVVTRRLVKNNSCLVNISSSTDYRWTLTPITEGFFVNTGWDPLRLRDCHDARLLDLLRKLG